jgi:hypothetical protein
MKIKHTLILFAIGYGIDMIATWEKIMHMRYADFFLFIALIVKLVAVLLFIYKLLSHEKGKDFLNW